VSDYPKVNAGMLTQRTAGTLVLLDAKGGEYFALDEVGALIWGLCDGSRTVGEIACAVSAVYDVDGATAVADLAELLEELSEARLITFNA
jgi:hypothetical protein